MAGVDIDFHQTKKGEKELGPVFDQIPLPASLPITGVFTQACPDRRELAEIRKRSERVAAAYEVVVSYMLAANTALGKEVAAAMTLKAENEALRASLKECRNLAHEYGLTMREFATRLRISASQLSAWTSEPITTPPQFVD